MPVSFGPVPPSPFGTFLKSTAANPNVLIFKPNVLDEFIGFEIAIGKAWWEANTTGQDEAFAKKEALENRYNELLSSPKTFEQLKALQGVDLGDLQLTRQIRLIYLDYLDKQVDVELLNRMSSKANDIEKTFNTFRAQVGDQTFTDSQVCDVLKESRDSAVRKEVWQAAKQVGSEVATELRDLVLLRNQAAHKLGFADFHAMQLELNEQDQTEVLALFDELDELTREPFARVKREIDERLAQQYDIDVDALRPWHYHDPFFQEPQSVYGTDLDAPFRLAGALQRAGATQQAIAAFSQVLETDPDHLGALAALADLYEGVDRATDAERALQRIARLNPDIAYHHYQLAQFYERLGKRNKARRAFQQAEAIDPRHGKKMRRLR